MSIANLKHYIRFDTKIGDLTRRVITWCGLKLLKTGREFLKWSLGRCSWCGANCGFSSTVSNKGLRCSSLHRDCTKHE